MTRIAVLRALVVPLLVGGLLTACGEQENSQATDPTVSASVSESPSESSEPSESPEPSESTEPSESASADAWPQCSEIWRDGEKLPKPYAGCREGDVEVPAQGRGCSFGKQLVTYDNRYYAVPRGRIHEVSTTLKQDPGYRSAMKSCMA